MRCTNGYMHGIYNVTNSLINNNFARRVDASECKELLHKAYENNLVQCGENVRSGVTFICNCCGCCCEALVAAKRFGNLHPVQTTSFIPNINNDSCIRCGKCVKICPVDAISITKENDNSNVKIDENRCLGCGVCVRNCFKNSIMLRKRPEKIITPANSVHRAVLMAIE